MTDASNPLVQVVLAAVEIERRIPTQGLSWAGIGLWPLVRRTLHFTRLQKDPRQPNALSDMTQDARFSSELSLTVEAARQDEVRRAQSAMDRGEADVDLLFVSRLLDHSDTVNGQAYNRLVDPYLWHLRERFQCLKLEFSEAPVAEQAARFEPTEFEVLPDWQRDPRLMTLPTDIMGLAALKTAVEDIFGHPFAEASLTGYLPRLWVRRGQFEELLLRLKPKAVFVICYYSPDMLALCWACRDLGIPIVDIQHGQQGPYHAMYNHWTDLPQQGYHLLPDRFFCWGGPTQQIQQAGLSTARSRPYSYVAGHPWVGLWREDGPLQEKGALIDTLSGLKRDRVVLCALQPTLEDVIPPVLREAIAQRPDWMFLLRLHPHQHHKRDHLAAQLRQLGLENCNLDLATQAPLYPLVQFADHVVTLFSSVAWEASAFGKPVTIIDRRGFDVYAHAIAAGVMRKAQTAAEIVSSIEANWSPAESKAAFIETKPGLLHHAVQQVIDT